MDNKEKLYQELRNKWTDIYQPQLDQLTKIFKNENGLTDEEYEKFCTWTEEQEN